MHSRFCEFFISRVCRICVIYNSRDNDRRAAILEQIHFIRKFGIYRINVFKQI